jgi:hypothetical protein
VDPAATPFDGEGWSLEYLAIRYDRAHLLHQQQTEVQAPGVDYTMTLWGEEDLNYVRYSQETGHQSGRGIQGMLLSQGYFK